MTQPLKRCVKNPILTPQDLKPSHPDLKVVGVFNAGAVLHDDTFILLLRVAETHTSQECLKVPLMNPQGQLIFKSFYPTQDTQYDYSDTRFVAHKKVRNQGRVAYLTSLSHFRIARSHNGVDFTVDETLILPDGPYETFGIEDPRITLIDDTYHIVYTSVSEWGVCVSKMHTTDFHTFHRDGVIFPPENKDVALFPKKINGRFYAWHRPVPGGLGGLNMWLASSPNLNDWGQHQCVIRADDLGYNDGRLGAGAPPLETPLGWLHIVHGADASHRYDLTAIMSAIDDPAKITHRFDGSLLKPEAPYELQGFFDHVVFSCGAVVKDDVLYLYYGAADSTMALATISMEELYRRMIPYVA
jgi:predicted GH43/DUF377 family glycosyl hydrolase